MGYEPRRKMETKGDSVLGGDQEFLFNRNLLRNSSSSLGCSSRVYYSRSTEGVPFNWEMQPGTPRNPPKEEAIPPISPPPAVLSLGLPKPCIDQQLHTNKPPTSPLHRLKFWSKKSKTKKQRKNNLQHNGGLDKFDKVQFCSSDSEFMASSTSPRNSSSSSSSSFSFSKGQCSSLRSTPARDSFTSSGHFSCSPWKLSSFLTSAERYNIYIKGYAWSVSEKYILACDSVTLLVKPKYYDFFTRGLQPVHHYWPIRHENKCRSIKFAVDWGNNHKQKAQAIGKAASDFIKEELKMDYVYDYMFHLLNEYAKLLRFEPRIPKGAAHLCSGSMACPVDESPKKSMIESLVKSPLATDPCTMPPPYEPRALAKLYRRNTNSITQVQQWEDKFDRRA